MTVAELLCKAAEAFGAVTETPRLDAEILLAHALGIRRSKLLARLSEACCAEARGEFESFVERRLEFEPIAYIIGEWEFFSLPFYVEAPLLVPRPETEHLVEAVMAFVGDRPMRVLEVGTGTGCVAISIAHNAPNVTVVATDISELALDVAQRNAERHSIGPERLVFRHGDLFAALKAEDGMFDVVCSNPPYVEESAWPSLPGVIRLHEDPRALLGGKEGLDIIGRLATETRDHLRPGGLLAMEIGFGQYDGVLTILERCAYEGVSFVRDLAGIRRIAIGHMGCGQ